ncbi:Aspartic peptidase domain containing protein [Naviculisporaceae sp. PSN 640]
MIPKSGNLLVGGICAIAAASHVVATPFDPLLRSPPPGIKYTRPRAVSTSMRKESESTTYRPSTKSSHLRQTTSVQKIQGLGGAKTNARSVAAVLGAHQRSVGGFGYENITSASSYGTQYGIQVLWDGFPMYLILDTGSSDTWAVQRDFSCVDYTGSPVPQSDCAFGPAYPDPSSPYGLLTPPQHMYVHYADGETVSGPMGYSDITVGNITVTMQPSCLANRTYWFGNNFTTGLMGLAYPSITNAYLGSVEDGDPNAPSNQVQYSPLFNSMISQGLVPAPLFSMAIDRNASTGLIAFGGIAPVTGLDTSRTATVDLVVASLVERAVTAYQYSFYTIIVDGWQFGQTTNMIKYPYIIDSGTTLCYLPPDLAEAVASAYTPKAVYLPNYGAYFTNCNAIVPTVLAVILNGVKFFINPVDLIYRDMTEPTTGLCMTAFSTGGSGPYILGDVFMQNALVVFDHGEAKMTFIPRLY